MDSFETARQSFVSNLSPSDKAALGATEPASLLNEIRTLEQRHKDENLTRKLLQKAEPLIRGLERYGRALDIIAGAKPEILSPLWGGMRLVLRVPQMILGVKQYLI